MEERKRTIEESNDDVVSIKKPKESRELYNTLAAYGCRKGERADMQDTHILEPKFDLSEEKPFLSRCSFFAIFDGHAGPRASEYCQNHMSRMVKDRISKSADFALLTKSLKSTFTEAYKQVDDGFVAVAKQNKPVWKDGTTATTMIILNNVIYVANIGDSKAVVARKKEDGSFSPVCLTVDHSPMAHDERMRIQKTGAVVKDGRINGVIEVSRSIGDVPFKSLGIICTPDLKKLTLSANDLFAIVACDGLWKSFTNLEAVTFASEQLEAVKKTHDVGANTVRDLFLLPLNRIHSANSCFSSVISSPTVMISFVDFMTEYVARGLMAAKSDKLIYPMDLEQEPNESREIAELRTVAEKLAAEAVRRKCGDNVSVIIVKLDMVEQP